MKEELCFIKTTPGLFYFIHQPHSKKSASFMIIPHWLHKNSLTFCIFTTICVSKLNYHYIIIWYDDHNVPKGWKREKFHVYYSHNLQHKIFSFQYWRLPEIKLFHRILIYIFEMDRQLSCKKCPKSFKLKYHLQRHEILCTGFQSYITCEEYFQN